jgi:hypothetical protein
MKKCLKFTGLLLIIGLALTGCKKKEPPPEAAKPQEMARTEPTQPAAGAPSAEQQAQNAAKAMAEASKNVDTSDAPEYLKKMVVHITALNKLTRENMTDCGKAESQITKYVEGNKGELETMAKAADEAKKKASEQDKMKWVQQAMALMSPIMSDTMKIQMEFTQKCPQQAKNINEVMSKYSVKN